MSTYRKNQKIRTSRMKKFLDRMNRIYRMGEQCIKSCFSCLPVQKIAFAKNSNHSRLGGVLMQHIFSFEIVKSRLVCLALLFTLLCAGGIAQTSENWPAYRAWLSVNFLEGDNTAFTATPHDDGLTNIEKFALGLDGKIATQYTETGYHKIAVDPEGVTPRWATFTYAIAKAAKYYTHVIPLFSADLQSWEEAPHLQVDETDLLEIYQAWGDFSTGKAFFRLKIKEGDGPPSIEIEPSYSLTWPQNEILLEPTLTNPSGAELAATWSVISGEGNVIFEDAGSLSTTVSFDSAGDYILELVLKDGNGEIVASTQVTVTVNVSPSAILSITGGNNQEGGPNEFLSAEPLIIRLTDKQGQPIANELVTFTVTQGNGELVDLSDDEGEFVTSLQTETNGQGFAQVHLRLPR